MFCWNKWVPQGSVHTLWGIPGSKRISLDKNFSSVQLLSRIWLFVTPWTAARQASLSITNSWRLPKLRSIESVMPSNHLILCCPLLLLPSIFQLGGLHFVKIVTDSEVVQSCPTLCDPMDCSLPRSSIHGIFQARVLEWVAISFSRGSSWPRDQTQVSHIVDRQLWLYHCRQTLWL